MTENSEHKGLQKRSKKTAQPKIMVKMRLNTFQTQEKRTMLSSFPE
jgi:hypothetical protein